MPETVLAKLGSPWSIVWAIILIVLGFLVIAIPAATLATSAAVVFVIGWLLVFSGALQFIYAFQSHGAGHIIWKLLVAVAYLIVGIWILVSAQQHPGWAIAAFTWVLAIFFVVEGVFDLVAYFQTRHIPGSGWILFDGIVTLLLGIVIWKQPPQASWWVIGTLVAISMIFTGTTRLMLSLAARRLARA